jgi:hypothetical protein
MIKPRQLKWLDYSNMSVGKAESGLRCISKTGVIYMTDASVQMTYFYTGNALIKAASEVIFDRNSKCKYPK